jgi:hypothetical protein
LDKEQILRLYDRDQRYEVEYPDTRREALPHLVRHANKAAGGEGAILYSHLDQHNVEVAIREQIAYFRGIGQGFEWKVYDYDRPADLRARLAAHGFECEDAESILVLDLAEVPAVLLEPLPHDLRRITDPDQLDQVVAVKKQVWGEEDTDVGRYLAEALTNQPKQMSVFVGFVGGRAASVGWIYYPAGSRFASLWGGSTLSRFRRRGLYTALLAVRLREALERGVEYVTVDASDMSRPILERHGFVKIAEAVACHWRPN